MIIIGENIHVIAKDVSVAIRERNAKVIQGLTKEQTQSGADYIDVNVGPMKKDTEETMKWLSILPQAKPTPKRKCFPWPKNITAVW